MIGGGGELNICSTCARGVVLPVHCHRMGVSDRNFIMRCRSCAVGHLGFSLAMKGGFVYDRVGAMSFPSKGVSGGKRRVLRPYHYLCCGANS